MTSTRPCTCAGCRPAPRSTLTLQPAHYAGTVYVETGVPATSGPRAFTLHRYTTTDGAPAIIYRPQDQTTWRIDTTAVYEDGHVNLHLVRQRKTGGDYLRGGGMPVDLDVVRGWSTLWPMQNAHLAAIADQAAPLAAHVNDHKPGDQPAAAVELPADLGEPPAETTEQDVELLPGQYATLTDAEAGQPRASVERLAELATGPWPPAASRIKARDALAAVASENGWAEYGGNPAIARFVRGDVTINVTYTAAGAVRFGDRTRGYGSGGNTAAGVVGTRGKRETVLAWLTEVEEQSATVRCARCSTDIPADTVNELCPASNGTGPHLPAADAEQTAASIARFGPVEPTGKRRVGVIESAQRAQVCPHGHGPLRWVDDAWICPKCGDEWPAESETDDDEETMESIMAASLEQDPDLEDAERAGDSSPGQYVTLGDAEAGQARASVERLRQLAEWASLARHNPLEVTIARDHARIVLDRLDELELMVSNLRQDRVAAHELIARQNRERDALRECVATALDTCTGLRRDRAEAREENAGLRRQVIEAIRRETVLAVPHAMRITREPDRMPCGCPPLLPHQPECDDDLGCEGHPAGPGDPLGETSYCDGACRPATDPEGPTP